MTRKLALLLWVLLAAFSPAAAQFEPQVVALQEVVIYEGDASGGAVPLTLSGWGSGKAEEVGSLGYIGPRVLRVMTHGYYAGARLDLRRPVSLTDYLGKPNAYIRLALRPALVPATATETVTPGAPGPTAGYPPSAGYRRRGPGWREREEEEGAGIYQPTVPVPTAPTTTATSSQPEFRAEKLSLVLISDKRRLVVRDFQLQKDKADAQGWVKVAVPLALCEPKIEEKPTEPESLQRLIIFGDRSDIFYVGEVRLSLMPITPISLQVKVEPVETQPGKQVKFTATASAGLAPLKIVWDFDDSDGLQEDAEGSEVVNIYYKVKEYTATCIVKDLTGGNQPFKRTMGVRIVAR